MSHWHDWRTCDCEHCRRVRSVENTSSQVTKLENPHVERLREMFFEDGLSREYTDELDALTRHASFQESEPSDA